MTNAGRIISQAIITYPHAKSRRSGYDRTAGQKINTLLLRPNSKVALKSLRFRLLQPQSIKAAFITPLLEDMKKLY